MLKEDEFLPGVRDLVIFLPAFHCLAALNGCRCHRQGIPALPITPRVSVVRSIARSDPSALELRPARSGFWSADKPNCRCCFDATTDVVAMEVVLSSARTRCGWTADGLADSVR